jgi:hypothetical protein
MREHDRAHLYENPPASSGVDHGVVGLSMHRHAFAEQWPP